jgi:hypothetical protein
MKRFLGVLSVGLMALSSSSVATAGERVNVFVTISTGANGDFWAYGSLGTARNTDDDEQDIGCYVEATTSGVTVRCEAHDLKGNKAECSSQNEHIAKAVAALDGDGMLSFTGRAGECQTVSVGKRSRYAPKE